MAIKNKKGNGASLSVKAEKAIKRGPFDKFSKSISGSVNPLPSGAQVKS